MPILDFKAASYISDSALPSDELILQHKPSLLLITYVGAENSVD